MSLLDELKRRNVIRSGAAYLVIAWLIIQIVETVGPAFGFGDVATRVAVIALAIGFIPALLLSWLFELTPGGIRREAPESTPLSPDPAQTRNLDRAIILALTLALCLFAANEFLLEPARNETQAGAAARQRAGIDTDFGRSIAVLPFENMSNDPANEYFSDGIAEEILNSLATVQGLRVIARSASFAYRQSGLAPAELAQRLGAAYVLEGSVRKMAQRARITAHLIETDSNTQVWSASYDGTLDDVFALQDKISAAIVDELRPRLSMPLSGRGRPLGAVGADAHAAHLRGKYLIEQGSKGALREAIAQFREAVAIAPDFAEAHAELAIALLKAEPEEFSWDELMVEVSRHATIALTLAPDSPQANAAQGRLLWNLGKDKEALVYYTRALELNPNLADAWRWIAQHELLVGQEPAFAAAEKAAKLAPHSLNVYFYVYKLLQREMLTEAEREIDRFSKLDPLGGRLIRGMLDSMGGNWATMILAIMEAESIGRDKFPAEIGLIWSFPHRLAAVGLEQEAIAFSGGTDPELVGFLVDAERGLALARRQIAEEDRSIDDRVMGSLLAHAGQYAEARPYLERQFEDNGYRLAGSEQFTAYLAEALYAARRATGDEDGAAAILEALEDNVSKLREAGITGTDWVHSTDYQAGIAAYLRGDRERGLALVGQAAAKGFWLAPPSDFHMSMYNEPEFADILSAQAGRQARERSKLLSVVCNDYPYTSLWQPSPETCEEGLQAEEYSDSPTAP